MMPAAIIATVRSISGKETAIMPNGTDTIVTETATMRKWMNIPARPSQRRRMHLRMIIMMTEALMITKRHIKGPSGRM